MEKVVEQMLNGVIQGDERGSVSFPFCFLFWPPQNLLLHGYGYFSK